MGQTASSSKACKAREKRPPSVPAQSSTAFERRQDYLNRLGIQKNKTGVPSINASMINHEASLLDSTIEQKPKGLSVWAVDGDENRDSVQVTFKPPAHHEAPGRLEITGPPTPKVQTQTTVDGSQDVDESKDPLEEMKRATPPDDFRCSFLRKLSYEKVWVPAAQRLPKSQTVIIFDWDDTLLCTSYLNRREGKSMRPTTEADLKLIGDIVGRLLVKASQMGHCFIITNAMTGWVEYSCARYLPALLPTLEKNVKIISARSRYEELYPHDVRQWKKKAFLDVQQEFNLPVVTNLNSLGDAQYEMDAARIMGQEFSHALVKTVKFQENPTPEELLKELEIVEQKFESVVGNARNLKVSLERRFVS